MREMTSKNAISPIPHFPSYRGPFVWKCANMGQNFPVYRGSPFIETPLIEVVLYSERNLNSFRGCSNDMNTVILKIVPPSFLLFTHISI